jgi:haloacetate dehalogenase
MFEGFESSMIDAGEAEIRARHGGNGTPLLLLHGSPQTHAMWHLLAPRLAREFSVVATDLRGYGDSSKPEGGEDHAPYSKRATAPDQVEVMKHFGFERFALCGHDRGVVTKLAVVDIVPTWEAFSRADMEFGLGYWHWFFLAHPTICRSGSWAPTQPTSSCRAARDPTSSPLRHWRRPAPSCAPSLARVSRPACRP